MFKGNRNKIISTLPARACNFKNLKLEQTEETFKYIMTIKNDMLVNCSFYKTILFINDYDAFIKENNPLLTINFDYLKYFIDTIEIKSHGISERTVSKNKDNFEKMYVFYNKRDYKTILAYIKQGKHLCSKCGCNLKLVQKELICPKCDHTYVCEICGEEFNRFSEISYHYSQKHNKKYKINFQSKIYCIYCRKELQILKVNNRGDISKYRKCNNKYCPEVISWKKRKAKNISRGKQTISDETRDRYRKVAFKREAIFKNTILPNGMTKKQSMSIKGAKSRSEKMKARILDGSFTPNITNSWCKSRSYVKGIPFRSTWEAYFYIYNVVNNKNLEYEKIRIKYEYLDGWHSYVTDFQDFDDKIIYEVKPNVLVEKDIVQVKEEAALKWCDKNGWDFVFITEDWFLNYYDETLLQEIDDVETRNKMSKNLKQFKG